MGACVSNHSERFDVLVKNFERSLPLNKITLQEFEERVKRLVTEADDDQVSIAQLIVSFDGNSHFDDLKVSTSHTYQWITSKYLVKKKQPEDIKPEQHKVWVNALMLLGILFCKASSNTKASAFYDIV
jgi:hypothetical protein